MGYRLDGPQFRPRSSGDVISDAVPLGSIQVPSSGLPILLMADHGTAGGYPSIGTIITADVSVAGQLAPGDWLEFVPCSRPEAVQALRDREALFG
jgi:antagonist of KipI